MLVWGGDSVVSSRTDDLSLAHCHAACNGCGRTRRSAGAFFLRLPIRGVQKDALLGLLGFLVFFVTILVSPLGYLLINNFIDPVGVGVVVAALWPLFGRCSDSGMYARTALPTPTYNGRLLTQSGDSLLIEGF